MIAFAKCFIRLSICRQKTGSPFCSACRDDLDLQVAVERLLKHHRPERLLLESEKDAAKQEERHAATAELEGNVVDRNRTRRFGKTVAEEPAASAVGLRRRQSLTIPRLSRQRRWLLGGSGLALEILILLGWWLHTAIQNSLAYSLEVVMREMLDHQVRALENWLATEEELIASWARVPDVVDAVADLNQIARTDSAAAEAFDLATHALLKRPTAIKILKPEQINAKNLSRFEREVQLASGLNHPNTINIYDYGATDQVVDRNTPVHRVRTNRRSDLHGSPFRHLFAGNPGFLSAHRA